MKLTRKLARSLDARIHKLAVAARKKCRADARRVRSSTRGNRGGGAQGSG